MLHARHALLVHFFAVSVKLELEISKLNFGGDLISREQTFYFFISSMCVKKKRLH